MLTVRSGMLIETRNVLAGATARSSDMKRNNAPTHTYNCAFSIWKEGWQYEVFSARFYIGRMYTKYIAKNMCSFHFGLDHINAFVNQHILRAFNIASNVTAQQIVTVKVPLQSAQYHRVVPKIYKWLSIWEYKKYIIIISGSIVFVRILVASHRRFRNLIKKLGRPPLDEWPSSHKGLYLHRTTQHKNTKTNIHDSSGIRTHDHSN
jgi:hypothetical protein